MTDWEKTVSSLTTLIEGRESEEGWEPVMVPLYVARDAISLLREQDPVKPYIGHSIEESRIHFRCGACQQAIDREDRFCRSCGKAVAWDD